MTVSRKSKQTALLGQFSSFCFFKYFYFPVKFKQPKTPHLAGFILNSLKLPTKSVVSVFLMAVPAINRPVFRRLKRQLGNLSAAVSAGPIALKHLALETSLRSLAGITLKGHIFLTKLSTQLRPTTSVE